MSAERHAEVRRAHKNAPNKCNSLGALQLTTLKLSELVIVYVQFLDPFPQYSLL